MIDNHWIDKSLKEVLVIDCLSIVETDKVNHAVETDIMTLVVEIQSFGMSSDEFDKETGSSDGLQPKQADLSCVHALNKLHLQEIHVVPSKHEADQCQMSGPFSMDSRIIRPCCLFIMYSSIMLVQELYISSSNIGGRLSASERIVLSARVIIEKFNASEASTSGIFTIELYAFPNNTWVYDTGCGTHICNTSQGLKGCKKLKHGALSLYMGNGMRATVEAIGSFDLILPSGLIIVLDNCHFALTVTRGVVSISRLKRMEMLQRDGLLQPTHDESHKKYKSCTSGKITRKPFSHQVERAKDLLGLIHTDVCGLFKTVSREGANYFITFTDDFSRYGFVYLMKHKHEVFETFKVFQNEVENQLGKKIKAIRSDQGGEYLSRLRNRTLLDMVRSMMNLTTLPKSFWGYALETASQILNMVPTKKVDRTPYEICFMVQETSRSHGLLELSRSDKGLEIIQEEDTQPSENTSKEHNKVASIEVEPQNVGVPIRRSARIPQAPDRYGYYVDIEEYELGDLDEPPNYKATLAGPESDKWLEAMNTEMQSMKDNQIWILVELPPNGRTVESKRLFKKKTNMDGNVHTFKARLVAKGYTQTYRVDYGENFSSVADIRAIRIILAIATFYNFEIWFDEEIKKIGFTQNPDEPCVYLKASRSNVAFLVLYVDDILLMGNNVTMLKEVKSWLCKCFSMKDLGEAAYILRIKIIRDRSKRLIALSQSAYLEKILKKFRMENSKKGYTPMIKKPDYRKSQGAKTPTEVQRMQRVPYASAIEAKYIAAAEASLEAVWMRKFIDGLGGVIPSNKRPMEMLCDNKPALAITCDPRILKGAGHF
ncbi:retrotransposon protein, putative, ty1-copia subclass [Tanacetum coccineum]